MTHTVPLLSYAIWVPILAGLAVLATGGDRNAAVQRWLALAGAVTGLAVTLPLWTQFNLQAPGMQFVEFAPWIRQFNVNYHLGVDGISMLFILLNSLVTVLVVIAGWTVIQTRVAQYMASFLMLSGVMNGVFSALDGVLFYVFFEATLIPMFIIIGVWGGPNRVYAALKFFLYTLAGSLLMLVAVLYLYDKSGGSFALLDWWKLPLSLIAVVYIGLVALVQTDMKKLIAYSSISHMGFVTLGFFIFNAYGVEGALVQMISHGFVSAAMFLCVGVLYDRMHSRMIADYGGVVNPMPKFASFMMLFAMANCGLPGTSGFVGEFMVIMGAMQANFWLAFAAATTLIFGAAYTLWMYKRVIFGAVANDHVAVLKDLNGREFLVLGVLAAAVLWMGVYPLPFTEVMHASVSELLRHVALPKI